MSVVILSGFAKGKNAHDSGSKACKEALHNQNTENISAVMVFAPECFSLSEVCEGVRSELSGIEVGSMIGVTNTAEIVKNSGSSEDKVLVVFFSSKDLKFSSYHQPVESLSAEAGQKWSKGFVDKMTLKPSVMFLFSVDNLGVPEFFIDSLSENLPEAEFIGGSIPRKEDGNFVQFVDWEGCSDGVLALAVYGDISTQSGVTSDWVPIGKNYKVTRSNEEVVFSIENQPAVNFYKDYFGDSINQDIGKNIQDFTVMYPLQVMRGLEQSEKVIRRPVTVNYDGSVSFDGSVPNDSEIQIMIKDSEKNLTETEKLFSSVSKNYFEAPFVFVINDVSNKVYNGTILNSMVSKFAGSTTVFGISSKYQYLKSREGNISNKPKSSFYTGSLAVCAFK